MFLVLRVRNLSDRFPTTVCVLQVNDDDDDDDDMILRERRRMLASARRAYKHAVDAGSFQPTLRCVEELLKPVYPELYYAVAAVAHSNIDGVPTRRQSELDRARERRAIASLVHMLEASSQRVHFLEDEFSLMLLTAGENARRAADGTGIGRSLSAWYDMKNAILRDIDAHTYAWAMKRLLECGSDRAVVIVWGDDLSVSFTRLIASTTM